MFALLLVMVIILGGSYVRNNPAFDGVIEHVVIAVCVVIGILYIIFGMLL